MIYSAKNEALRKLKDELHRAMINQKTKRNEIKELQNKLNHADGIIKKLNNEEGNYKTRIKMLEVSIIIFPVLFIYYLKNNRRYAIISSLRNLIKSMFSYRTFLMYGKRRLVLITIAFFFFFFCKNRIFT